MKKRVTFSYRIGSLLLSVLFTLQLAFTYGLGAVGESNDSSADSPALSFGNEKYEGIKVFKNIYSNEEYVKGKGNRTPLRDLYPEVDGIYDINDLRYDEFAFVLYGAQNKDDLYNAGESPAMPSVKYQRRYGTLLYYRIPNNKTVGEVRYDLILAPYDINDYFLYYSNGNGTIEIVYESYNSVYSQNSSNENDDISEDDKAVYTNGTYHNKFLMDAKYYSSSADAELRSLFSNYRSETSIFYTNAADGSFLIFDGDVAAFDEIDLSRDNCKFVRVRESWQFLRDLNAERRNAENAADYTGEYVYMKDTDAVSDVVSVKQSGSLEIANRFDKPIQELEVGKTVPFFGVATSDINPFRTTDVFEYRLLINSRVPESIQYRIIDLRTNEMFPSPENEEELPENVVKYANEYRYVTTDGSFSLCAEQRAVFYGVNSGDRVEIREYLSPDSYSVLDSVQDNATFQYFSSEEGTGRPYASITIQYGDEPNQRQDPTFTNVPNVLQVRKRVEGLDALTDLPFEFTIKRLLTDPYDPSRPYMYNGEYATDCEFITDENGIPLTVNDENGIPEVDEGGNKHYQTTSAVLQTYTYYLRSGDDNIEAQPHYASGGVFYLSHEQTAMFTGLRADTFYLVTEKNISTYNLQGTNPRVLKTRSAVVSDPNILSRSENYYELFINERSEMKGIVITKKVIDPDNRINPNAYYNLRIEKQLVDGSYEPVRNTEYYYKDGVSGYEKSRTDNNGCFRVKYNKDNFIVRFPEANGEYRITETDPNDFEDQNNPEGENAPNLYLEDHLYITDVQHTEYILMDHAVDEEIVYPPVTFNDDRSVHTDDISVTVKCNPVKAAGVEFTNRVPEKSYYFDIEKLAYIDDNIHRSVPDESHRFRFRIERFDSMEEALKGTAPRETFYTDIACTEKLDVSENAGVYSVTADGQPYDYVFCPIDSPYSESRASAAYSNGMVTRIYKKIYASLAHGKDTVETYKFPTSIYRGHKRLVVKKQGFYRITETAQWSGAIFDFCTGSNLYKGYLDHTFGSETFDGAKNRLYADYMTTHEAGYDSTKGVLERSVILLAGEHNDKTGLNTLGCSVFGDEAKSSVSYFILEEHEQFIQQRNENGDLLYYENGSQGAVTTEKYSIDGSRREPVPAPLEEFRIQRTVTAGSQTSGLYFDAERTMPVYEYAVDPENAPDWFETVTTGTGEDAHMEIAKFDVYNDRGVLVQNIKCAKPNSENINNEDIYSHSSRIWSRYKAVSHVDENVMRPMASFSNVESEFAFLNSAACVENTLKRVEN